MAYISTIPEEAASGEVAALYQADREAVGFVRNLTKVFSLAPEVCAVWVQLNTAIKARMDLRRYELATIAAARRIRSTYCMLAHGSVLLD
jgi:alkylhydroperoxidase/carboxymuconolactone decarboxylase family protein YurZ